MARKGTHTKDTPRPCIIDFDFGNRTYQIDTERRKVYRSFVEIETSKAFEIYSVWRARTVSA